MNWREVIPKLKACIIIGITARHLTQSANKAGIEVFALDLFADLDTQQSSSRAIKVKFEGFGFESESLFTAIEAIDPKSAYPVVYSGGFEGNSEQLNQISKQRHLIGNSAEQVSQLRDFRSFCEFLYSMNIPFPETRFQQPNDSRKWLQKDIRGTGGLEVSWKSKNEQLSDYEYYQIFVEGKTISATVLATETDAEVVGFSEQWNACGVTQFPFAYGGAVSISPNEISQEVAAAVRKAAKTIVAKYSLRGLITIDTIVNGEQWYLLEVNPRPGFTMELHEYESSFFPAHCAAFEDSAQKFNVNSATEDNEFVAHSIIYGSKGIKAPENWFWDSWVVDRPSPGDLFFMGDPVCTVVASAKSSDDARKKVKARHKATVERLKQWESV